MSARRTLRLDEALRRVPVDDRRVHLHRRRLSALDRKEHRARGVEGEHFDVRHEALLPVDHLRIAEIGQGELCVVQPGDTLSQIAQQFGVSLAQLLAVNPAIIDPNVISAGQEILIPT